MTDYAKIGACALLGALALHALIGYVSRSGDGPPPSVDEVAGHVPVSDGLRSFVERTSQPPRLIKVADGVMLVRGVSFMNANVIIIEGPDGLIIVDTAESPHVAAQVLRLVREETRKPIRAIVYTHFHADHIQGAQAFIEDPDHPPDIWAHERLVSNLHSDLIASPKTSRGTLYQLGIGLGSAVQVWPRLPDGLELTVPRLPNRIVRDDVEHVQIAGLNVTFVHIPGETTDHLGVWVPQLDVVIPGDLVYFAFPNVFAIRGTAQRDCLVWAGSVRRLRALNAQHILYSHGEPLSGRREVYDLLTVYAAAIQYVHDQTVRRMNELRHPDDISRLVRLPPDLASRPFLQELYGRVDWTSRSVYQRYVGWFSGDPIDLDPLTFVERAQRLADLVGVDRLVAEAEIALQKGDKRWALELSSAVLRLAPRQRHARAVRLRALRQFAAEQVNSGARNFYLSSALDDYGLLEHTALDVAPLVRKMDLGVLLNLLTVRLKAERTHGVDLTLVLHVENSNKTHTLRIRHSVLEIDDVTSHASNYAAAAAANDDQHGMGQTVVVSTNEDVWKGVMFGKLPAATAYTSGQLKVTGSVDLLKKFLSYFE